MNSKAKKLTGRKTSVGSNEEQSICELWEIFKGPNTYVTGI